MKRLAWILAVLAACAQEAGETPAPSALSRATESSQGDGGPEDRRAYFGDLHIHTRLSLDAYVFGTLSRPDDAYRFAKGEAIGHVGGTIRLRGEPLDFLGVTDHAGGWA